jgi:hypothetical protein
MKRQRPDGFYRARALEAGHRAMCIRFGIKAEFVDVVAVFERDKGLCHYCGRHVNMAMLNLGRWKYSLAPVSPIGKGLTGTHTFANLCTAHLICRRKKRAVDPAEFPGPSFSSFKPMESSHYA